MIRYGIIRYSHRYSNYLQKMRNDDTLWYYQVFSSIFEILSTKRNEVMYDVFRYSLAYEELEYHYSIQHIESTISKDERNAYACHLGTTVQ